MPTIHLKAALALLCAALACAAAPVPKDAGKAGDGIADPKQRVRSKNNIKQIMIALHSYHDANGVLPRNVEDKNGKPLLSWRVLLLPFIEHDNLFTKFKLDEPWDSENNKKLLAMMPDVYKVGIEEKFATKTYYQGFAGPGAAFEPGQKLTLVGFTDGTSNTVAVVEAGPPVEWSRPADIAYDPKKAFPKLDGPFRNVVMAGLMDGTAFPFKPDLKGDDFHNFVQRADGNVVDLDEARADLKAVTKEEKELAAKVQKENLELLKKVLDGQTELFKLRVGATKKEIEGVTDLEKLYELQEGLRRTLEALKRDAGRPKEGGGK